MVIKVEKYIACFVVSIMSALLFYANHILPFALMLFFIYMWLLFKYPEIALFISILVIFNGFSMFSQDIFRLSGAFRIRDIFFLLAFIPLLIGIYKGDNRLKYVFSNPLAKGIYVLLIMVFIQALITKFRFPEESINSMIRIGRKYLYYCLFYPALFILLDKEKFRRFTKIFIGCVMIFCGLYIIQYLVGPSHKVFLAAHVRYLIWQGSNVTRVHIVGMVAATLLFHISLFMHLFHENFKYRVFNFYLMILLGIQTVITFGRAHIFGVCTGILFGIICAGDISKWKKILKIAVGVIAIIVFVSISLKVVFPDRVTHINKIASRVTSIYSTVKSEEGTFNFRVSDTLRKKDLLVNNALFGIGFLHDETSLFPTQRGFNDAFRTSDVGIVTLLVDFGILGILWVAMMVFIVFKRGMNVYKNSKNHFNKIVCLGVISYIFGRIFAIITLPDFVVYDRIVVITLSFVLLEIMNNQEYEFNRGQNGIINSLS